MNRKSKVSEIMAEKLIVADSHNSFTQIMDFSPAAKSITCPLHKIIKLLAL